MPDMLEEHAPRDGNASEKESSFYIPDEEEKKQVTKLNSLFQRAKKYRERYDYAWPDYYKLFRGRQWKEQRPSYRSSEVINIIWQSIQSSVPILTDAKPKFEFSPKEPSDREFAELMNEVAASDWQSKKWLYTLHEVIYDANILGTGLSSLTFSPEENEIVYKSIDPFYFFPDPDAENLSYKCGYTCVAEPEAVEKLRAKAPSEKSHAIRTDITDFTAQNRIELSAVKYHSPSSDQLYVETSGYDNHNQQEVLVKTFYIKDESTLDVEETDDAGQKTFIRKKKFPNGRKSVVVNDMLLYDDETGYDDDKVYPYQLLTNYMLSRQFWGISDLEALEGPQRIFNKLISYVLDTLYLTGNPIWIVDTTSGIDTDNLTNQPGLIVEKEPGSEVRREAGVALQPYVLSLIDRLRPWFDQIAGSQDITRGLPTGGVTAASAIENLQNAAQTRLRLKIRNMDAYLQDFGQTYVSRVLQFYDAPRVFRLTNKDGSKKFFKMHIEKGENSHRAVVQGYSDDGMILPGIKEIELKGNLDVTVTTSSSLPFAKSEQEQKLFQLFDRGIIDSEEVLKSMEYPNWELIADRMKQKALDKQEPIPSA